MVKIFATIQSAKIGLAGIYFQTKLTFSEISIQNAVNKLMYHILYFTIHFQSVTIQDFSIKLTLQYKNTITRVYIIHTLPAVKTGDMSTDQTVRTKQSLLVSTRHSKAPLQFISFVQAFGSMVQIYTFSFKPIQSIV